jgi:hypothetical protein
MRMNATTITFQSFCKTPVLTSATAVPPTIKPVKPYAAGD